jgi:hypothetical protein
MNMPERTHSCPASSPVEGRQKGAKTKTTPRSALCAPLHPSQEACRIQVSEKTRSRARGKRKRARAPRGGEKLNWKKSGEKRGPSRPQLTSCHNSGPDEKSIFSLRRRTGGGGRAACGRNGAHGMQRYPASHGTSFSILQFCSPFGCRPHGNSATISHRCAVQSQFANAV